MTRDDDPVPDRLQTMLTPAAREDATRRALMKVRTAAYSFRGSHEHLYETIKDAADLGIPHREIAEAAGFTRQWIQKVVSGGQGMGKQEQQDRRTAARMQRQLEHGRRAGETRENSVAEDLRQSGRDADKHSDADEE